MSGGGKSRKSGGVSKRLINHLIKSQAVEKSTTNTKELMHTANYHHQAATAAWAGWLDHAHSAGKALLKAKATVEHGCWQQTITDRFEGTYSNAKVYMRVARYWNDHRITAARDEGVAINSIKSFLDVITKRPLPKAPATLSHDEKAVKECLADIRQHFSHQVNNYCKDMELDELKVLNNNFDYFWLKWMRVFYHVYRQHVQMEARQKARKALNHGRKPHRATAVNTAACAERP